MHKPDTGLQAWTGASQQNLDSLSGSAGRQPEHLLHVVRLDLPAGILTAIAKSHCSPLTAAFTRPDFLQRLLDCAFAPSICVLVRLVTGRQYTYIRPAHAHVHMPVSWLASLCGWIF